LLIKPVNENHTKRRNSMKYQCPCGYIYDEEKEGVKFEDLPADYECPECGLGKDAFEPAE
jgi:rubredoxin